MLSTKLFLLLLLTAWLSGSRYSRTKCPEIRKSHCGFEFVPVCAFFVDGQTRRVRQETRANKCEACRDWEGVGYWEGACEEVPYWQRD